MPDDSIQRAAGILTDTRIWKPEQPYRCPDCVTQSVDPCPHRRPTVGEVMRGAWEAPRR